AEGPACRTPHAQAPRGSRRAVRHRRHEPAPTRSADRRRPDSGRPAAPSGCVSLTSTPSPSTAMERSSGWSIRSPRSAGRWPTGEAGAPKPEPAVFLLALEQLGVAPARALHVGDEAGDEDGARAAGMRFAPAPLATALAGWD